LDVYYRWYEQRRKNKDAAWNSWWQKRQLQCKFLDVYYRWYDQRRKNIHKVDWPEFDVDCDGSNNQKTQKGGVFVWRNLRDPEDPPRGPVAPSLWIDGLIIQQYDTDDETGGSPVLNPSPEQNPYGDCLSQLRGLIMRRYNKGDISDSFFQWVPNLKWLNLFRVYNAMRPSALTPRMFQYLTKLESLSVSAGKEVFWCEQDDETTYANAFRNLQSLCDLRLQDVKMEFVHALFPHLSHLKTLCLSDVYGVVELDWALVHLSRLETLDIEKVIITNWDPTKAFDEKQPSREEKTTTVWHYLTELRNLVLRDGIITYDSFDFSPLQKLEYFECSKGSDVNYPEFQSLRQLPNLRMMNIDFNILAKPGNSYESCFAELTQVKKLHLHDPSEDQQPKSWNQDREIYGGNDPFLFRYPPSERNKKKSSPKGDYSTPRKRVLK
jgi:hypothetical protein